MYIIFVINCFTIVQSIKIHTHTYTHVYTYMNDRPRKSVYGPIGAMIDHCVRVVPTTTGGRVTYVYL